MLRVVKVMLLLAAVSLFSGCGGDEWPGEQIDRSAVGDVEGTDPDNGSDAVDTNQAPWANFDFGSNNRNAYLALGDSITAECGYPEKLDDLLGGDYAVLNRGVPGEESAGGLARVDSYLRNYGVGYLLVLYGANDLMHDVPIGQVVDNLRQIARMAVARHTLPILATVTPQPRYGDNRATAIAILSYHIKEMADEEGVPCVDLAAEFEGAGFELFPDGVHPNSTGARIIAMAFYETILAVRGH